MAQIERENEMELFMAYVGDALFAQSVSREMARPYSDIVKGLRDKTPQKSAEEVKESICKKFR